MKRLVFVFVLLASFIYSDVEVLASTVVRTGESISIKDDEKVDGPFYTLAGTLSIAGEVTGDIVAGAGTINLNAPAQQDLLLLGGTVSLNAPITEDVRIVAGDVTISESVGGSIFVIGGRLKILSTASVTGDVLFLGGEAVLEGKIGGQVLGIAETVRIDGEVLGGVDMDVAYLTIGDKAVIKNNIIYTSDNEITRSVNAVVEGEITRSDVLVENPTNNYREMAMAFLVSLFVSLSLYAVARRLISRILMSVTENVLRDAMLGLGVLLLVPVVIMILMVSVLGLFLGLIGLTLFLLMLVLAIPLLNMALGLLIAHTFTNHKELNILFITIGALLVQALWLIPVVGVLVLSVAYLATVGALLLGLYRLVRLA